MRCEETEYADAVAPGATARMVKPPSSTSANTPPVRPALVHTPPHSTVLAMCQQLASSPPRMSG